MTLIIHQAVFGQDESMGFGLLRTTHSDTALIRQIGNSADLSERAPSQVSWLPALRGRRWQDFYLLFRTYPDLSPGMRPGRVYSHVLIIEVKDVDRIKDIRPLLKLLPVLADKEISIEAFTPILTTAIQPSLTFRLKHLLHELVFCGRKGPIVWVGQENFDEAASLIWQILNKDEKERLLINIGFMPNQLRNPDEVLQLIAVPDGMIYRWTQNFYVIEPTVYDIPIGEIESYAIGNKEDAPNLSAFIDQLGIDRYSLDDLATLHKVAAIAGNIPSTSLKQLLALTSVVYSYKPGDQSAITIKQQIVHQLKELATGSNSEDLVRLGSLPDNAFNATSLKDITQTVVNRLFELVSLQPASDIITLLTQWPSNSGKTWWKLALLESIRLVYAQWPSGTNELVFGLWSQPDSDAFLKLLPTASWVEDKLIRSVPKQLLSGAWETGINLARSRSWLSLHIVCLLKTFTLETALKKQLEIDTNPSYSVALRLASEQVASKKEFVQASVLIADPRLINIAAELCRKDATLLIDLNIQLPGWQTLWLTNVRQGADLWDGIQQPQQTVYDLLDWLLSGGQIEGELLRSISVSDYSNLRHYSNRPIVWEQLFGKDRTNFLLATATAIFLHDQPEDSIDSYETDIINTLSDSRFAEKMLVERNASLSRAVAYIKRFSLPESNLIKYIQTIRSELNDNSFVEMGRLIDSKKWRNAAQEVYRRAHATAGFRTTLLQCLDLLPTWDRFRIKYFGRLEVSSVSNTADADDWWELLLEETRKVYPEGPNQNGIWEASGGKKHEIRLSQNGGEQWSDLLRGLRYGRSRVSISILLEALIEDAPRNEAFKLLRQTLPNAK